MSFNELEYAKNKISSLLTSLLDASNTNIELDKIIFEILEISGKVCNANRSYLFENYFLPNSSLIYTRQILEWCNGISPQQDSECLLNIIYPPEMLEYLSAGKVYNATTKDLDEYSKSILEPQEIKSIMLAPIYINGDFWGHIGFDNCQTEKLWEPVEEEFLLSVASMIGKTIDNLEKLHNKKTI